MQKTLLAACQSEGDSRPLTKIYRVMRLTAFLLTAFFVQVHAHEGTAQTVSFTGKDLSLKTIFAAVQQQTGYTIFGKQEVLENSKPVTITAKNMPLKAFLDEVLKDQQISYQIKARSISLSKKQAEPPAAKPANTLESTSPSPDPVKGVVRDSTGAPLAGASVKVKGTNKGASTNAKGEFTIDANEGDILVISYVGYLPKEIKVLNANTGHSTGLVVQLNALLKELDETVVIAYGTTTKRMNTGSVSKVSAAEIEKQPISNPIAALEGRVPGLFITQVNGLPGSGFNVQIRGRNSISQGTLPLYIIDGIPFDAANPTQVVATGSMNVNNPFNSINPGDIESIEVLKDADATSIYGSRGANGVILITTKRPKAGNLNVDFSTYAGWGKVTRGMKMLDGGQYRAMRREALANDGLTPDLNNAFDVLGLDTTIHNDWPKQLFGGTAKSTNAQLRLSGGSATTRFAAGLNYYKETTVFPDDNSASRKSVNLSVSHNSSNHKFSALLTTSYSYNHSGLIWQDLTQFQNKQPYGFQLKDEQGKLVWTDGAAYYGNPLSYTMQSYTGVTDMLTTSAVLSYSLAKGLVIKANGGYNLLDYDESLLVPIASLDPAFNSNGNAGFAHNKVRNWSIEPTLEYSTTFLKAGKITAMVGGSWQEKEGQKDQMNGDGYTSDALIHTIAGAATITASSDYSLYHYNAIFGRLSLDWANTYLLNISGRRDGSSRFGPGNQFANFYSIGGAWIFSNLDFFKVRPNFLSFGKLRASYGTSGNDQIGDYKYLDSYSPITNTYQQSLSLFPSRLYNENYGWEQFNKLEGAVELGFFKDRIYLSAAYFRNRSSNQLVYYTLPGQTGFSNVMLNFPGKVENKGWELELRTENIRQGDFHWSSSFNLTIPRNRLLAFPGIEKSSYANSYVIGQPLTVLLGYKFLGVDPETGAYKVWDKNGDGVYNSSDYLPQGSTDPQYYGGLQNSISFKGITIDFFFQFVKQLGRHPVYSSSAPIGLDGNVPVAVLDHWQKPGDIAPYAKYTQAYGTELYTSYELTAQSGAVLTDASFIRLKNASLTYQLPGRWLNRLKIKSCAVSLQAQNLLTITSFAGPDPESQSVYILPPLRMITAGLKLTL